MRCLTPALLSLSLVACTTVPPSNNGNDNGNVTVINDNSQLTEIVPGTDFDDAPAVSLGTANRVVLDGSIQTSDEVHVYKIGAVLVGDRFDISAVTRNGPNLDPMIALFDADGYRLFWNDDINQRVGNFNSQIVGTIRHDSNTSYVAIASSNFSMTTGDYRITVQRSPQVDVTMARRQTVVLNWHFAPDVVVANTPFGDAAGADAGAINSAFAGQTDDFRALLLALVRADFAPYDVTILTSDDPQPAGQFTTVYFADQAVLQIFGLSDEVDFYNANSQDNAIIFLGAFDGLGTDFDGVVQAIANVTSHEIGHTLGLMHTTDLRDLMDTTGADITLLEDQALGIANLFDFPVGLQNALLLLEETVGRAPLAAPALMPGAGPYRCGTCGASLATTVRRHHR